VENNYTLHRGLLHGVKHVQNLLRLTGKHINQEGEKMKSLKDKKKSGMIIGFWFNDVKTALDGLKEDLVPLIGEKKTTEYLKKWFPDIYPEE